MKTKEISFIKNLIRFGSKIIFIVIGLASLAWFLIRVIPKPSRASYPCQRAAFPLASSFIAWLTGTAISMFTLKKAKEKLVLSRFLPAALLLTVALVSFSVSWLLIPSQESYSRTLAKRVKAEPAPMLVQQSLVVDNMAEPLAKVSIVKSAIEQVSDLTPEDIEILVRQAVEKDGILDTLIKDGQTVVIKPNLVSNLEYSAGSSGRRLPSKLNGVITDWRTIRAVVNIVRDYNPSGMVYVLEGSADGASTRTIMAQYGYNHDNIPGVDEFIYLEEASGGWEEWDSEFLTQVTLPTGMGLYPDNLKPNNSAEFYLNKIYYESDILISVPVLKNHLYTYVTGAVKNVGIGATPQRIYAGPSNNHRHINNRIDHQNYTNLQKFIHDYFLCRPVDYVIMEGLQGTDYGPVAEHPVNIQGAQKNMRLILAGKDAVAVDAIESLLMGYDPTQVNHLVYLNNDATGCGDPAAIRVLVSKLQNLKQNFTHYQSLGAKYFDFIPPEAEITSHNFAGNTLDMSLTSDETLLKVEILIDNEYLDNDILGGFGDIHVELEEAITSETHIEIRAYDAYLNCTSFYFKGNEVTYLGDLLPDTEFNIYPNLAADQLSISLSDNHTGFIRMDIFDLLGKQVSSERFHKIPGDFTYTANVESLEPGNYVIQLTNTNLILAKMLRKL